MDFGTALSVKRLRPAATRSRPVMAGRKIVFFAGGLAAVLVLVVGGNLLLDNPFNPVAGRDKLFTSEGLFGRDHPLTQRLLSILFPGYEDEIRALEPNLLENSEFASPTLVLEDGRRVKVMIPRNLPFRLARAKAPDVIVFGTSRAREGVRPDVLSRELGAKRVLNMSVSAATMETIRIIMDALFDRIDGPVDTIVVSIDDVSFIHNPGIEWKWRRLIDTLDALHTFRGRISAWGHDILNVFPRVQRAPKMNAIEPYSPCADRHIIEEYRTAKPPPEHIFRGSPDPFLVEAFQRVVIKARSRAKHVVFVAMPASEYYSARMANFNSDIVRQIKFMLGSAFIQKSLAEWGLSIEAFLGAKTRSPCERDPHHLNGRAAVTFTRHLAKLIKEQRGR